MWRTEAHRPQRQDRTCMPQRLGPRGCCCVSLNGSRSSGARRGVWWFFLRLNEVVLDLVDLGIELGDLAVEGVDPRFDAVRCRIESLQVGLEMLLVGLDVLELLPGLLLLVRYLVEAFLGPGESGHGGH